MSNRAVHHHRGRGLGAILVVCSCVAVQGAAAASSGLIERYGPVSVASWRQIVGAAVLIALLRPRISGRSRRQWRTIVALGVAMGAMNAFFYASVAVIPLGMAATLLYLGPFVVAAASTRFGWGMLVPPAALVGVVLVCGPAATTDVGGIVFGLVAAVALACYTLAGRGLGAAGGLDSLALAIGVSALVLFPAGIARAPDIAQSDVAIIVASGAVGVTVAFTCDFLALRLAGTRTVSVLFSLDPCIGTIIGAAFLHNPVTPQSIAGIALVVTAGAAAAAQSPLPRSGGGRSMRSGRSAAIADRPPRDRVT